MKMADVATFDNLEELAEMAEGLTTFVRQAVADGTNAHVAEKEILQRILAMGRQAVFASGLGGNAFGGACV